MQKGHSAHSAHQTPEVGEQWVKPLVSGHRQVGPCSETKVLDVQNEVSRPTTLGDHVEVAADALRSAIHAAYDEPGDETALVAELYRTIGDLTLVTDRLPELIRHLARRIEQLADIDGLDTDSTTDESGRDSALAAAGALQTAALELAALASGRPNPIADAHNRLGALKIWAGER